MVHAELVCVCVEISDDHVCVMRFAGGSGDEALCRSCWFACVLACLLACLLARPLACLLVYLVVRLICRCACICACLFIFVCLPNMLPYSFMRYGWRNMPAARAPSAAPMISPAMLPMAGRLGLACPYGSAFGCAYCSQLASLNLLCLIHHA